MHLALVSVALLAVTTMHLLLLFQFLISFYTFTVQGCRSNSECSPTEACLNGKCQSPCQCGYNAVCDVFNHTPICKCPNGYNGDPSVSCQPPLNPCEPNPCGANALCELDDGNPICYCPKGLTGNPFKNCSKYLL